MHLAYPYLQISRQLAEMHLRMNPASTLMVLKKTAETTSFTILKNSAGVNLKLLKQAE